MKVDMTWDEFWTLAYGMYVRDYYLYDDAPGTEPVCFDEFIRDDYLSKDDMMWMFNNDEREWSKWAEIYLNDPMIKEVME